MAVKTHPGGKPSVRTMLREFERRLPVLPASARLLAEYTAGNRRDIADRLEELARLDPTLALRIIALASARLDAEAPVGIPFALARVGADRVMQGLACSAAAAPGMALAAGGNKLWLHSLQVAMFARYFATTLPGLQICAEEAYFCGLLHDAGRFVTLAFAGDDYLAVDRTLSETAPELRAAEREIIGMDHAAIGAFACREWGLPGRVAAAIGSHHESAGVIATLTPESHRHLARLTKLADSVSFALQEVPDLGTFDPHLQEEVLTHHDVDAAARELGITLGSVTPLLRPVTYKSEMMLARLWSDEESPVRPSRGLIPGHSV